MNLLPKNNHVVVLMEEKKDEVTASGIILPKEVNEREAETAQVLACDPDISSIKEGDTIVFKSYHRSEVEIDNKKYGFIKVEDILGIIPTT